MKPPSIAPTDSLLAVSLLTTGGGDGVGIATGGGGVELATGGGVVELATGGTTGGVDKTSGTTLVDTTTADVGGADGRRRLQE